MAVFSAVFSFSEEAAITATLGATTSTSEIVLGFDRKFAVTATGAFNLKMGTTGMTAAAATDFEFPASAVFTIATTSATDRIRIFNPGAGNISYWIQPLAN